MATDISPKSLTHIDTLVVTETTNDLIGLINFHWRESVSNILYVCRLLYSLRERWGGSSPVWKQVVGQVPFSRGTINKMVRIGGDERLWDDRIAGRLPPHWGTLYEITTLDDKTLYESVGANIITPNTQRSEISFLKRAGGPVKAGGDFQITGRNVAGTWYRDYLQGTSNLLNIPLEPEELTSILAEAVPGYERMGKRAQDAVRRDFDTHLESGYFKPIVKYMEGKVRHQTDPLISIRTSKDIPLKRVVSVLRIVSDQLNKIPGVYGVSLSLDTIDKSQKRELDRLMISCDWIYEQVSEKALSGGSLSAADHSIKEFIGDPYIQYLLDSVDFVHPLYDFLRWWAVEMGVDVDQLDSVEPSGSVELPAVPILWSVVIKSLLTALADEPDKKVLPTLTVIDSLAVRYGKSPPRSFLRNLPSEAFSVGDTWRRTQAYMDADGGSFPWEIDVGDLTAEQEDQLDDAVSNNWNAHRDSHLARLRSIRSRASTFEDMKTERDSSLNDYGVNLSKDRFDRIRELAASLSADAVLDQHDGDGDADELDVIPGGKRSSYSEQQLLILELQREIRSYDEARGAMLREMSGDPDMNPADD